MPGVQAHVISILLANEPGVLARVAGLFSARGYNIESLTVAPTSDPKLSRVTIVSREAEALVGQVIRQLHKLVDVVDAVDLGRDQRVEREVLLLKLGCSEDKMPRIERLVGHHHAGVVERSEALCIIEMTATADKIDEFIIALEGVGDIMEIARSGTVSLGHGDLIVYRKFSPVSLE